MSKSSTTTKKKLPPIHPGRILLEDLKDESISLNKLSQSTHIPLSRLSLIVNGKRSITADTAARLAKFFGSSVEYWLNLQSNYEVRLLDFEKINREVTSIEQLRASAA
jgi:addiction module HigA family antidote